MMRSGGNNRGLMILSIFFPSIGFLAVANKLWNKNYHSVILFFAFWFGYFIFIKDVGNGDILRYKAAFDITANYSWDDFFNLLGNTFSAEKLVSYPETVVNSKPDVYALSLQFLVSRFTTNFRWFFGFVSLLYTFFFLQFIGQVLLLTGVKRNKMWKFFFTFLVVIVPFYVGVTGIRFWAALFVFLTFTIKYIRTNKPVNILFTFLSILIHYTFMFPVAILLIYRFLNISKFVLKVLVFGSIAFFTISTTTGLLGYADTVLELFEDSSVKEAADSYTNEEDIEERSKAIQSTNWYVWGKEVAVLTVFSLFFLLDFSGVAKWRTDKRMDSWYSLYVLFFCIFMLSNGLGSITRFKYVFYLLSLVRLLLLVTANRNNRSLNLVYYSMFPVMVLHFVVSCRAGFYYVDPLLLVGNPVLYFFTSSQVSLSEFIAGH
jgi:hypothetical protein